MKKHVTNRYMLCFVLLALLLSSSLQAARPAQRRGARRAKQVEAPKTPREIPFEVAIGPVALIPNSPATFDQPVHVGVQLQMAAIVDQALIRRHRSQIPAWARSAASNLDEVRVRPWWLALVPELFVISPGFLNTGIYGGIWRPLGLNIPFVDTPGFTLKGGADLDLVGLFVHSTTLGGGTKTAPSYTVVIRPGVHLGLSAEVPLSPSVRLSAGWSSDFFVPQALGQGPFAITPLQDSLWHLGGPFFLVHYRFGIPL